MSAEARWNDLFKGFTDAANRVATIPRVYTGALAAALRVCLKGTDIKLDQHQSNGMWAVHQMRARIGGDPQLYRIIIAPANAPIFIGEVPADEHFTEKLS